MEMAELTAVFGWMLVVNVAVYAFAAVFIHLARDWTAKLEARITGVPVKD